MIVTQDIRDLTHAIRINPYDDTLRLICADAYEEVGYVNRAEFIRVQCELAEFGGQSDDGDSRSWKKFNVLRKHESRLLRLQYEFFPVCVWKDWWNVAAGLPITGHGPTGFEKRVSLEWSRGFVGVVGCRLVDWVAGGLSDIVKEQPVMGVSFFDLPAAAYRYVGELGFSWTDVLSKNEVFRWLRSHLQKNPLRVSPRMTWEEMDMWIRDACSCEAVNEERIKAGLSELPFVKS